MGEHAKVPIKNIIPKREINPRFELDSDYIEELANSACRGRKLLDNKNPDPAPPNLFHELTVNFLDLLSVLCCPRTISQYRI